MAASPPFRTAAPMRFAESVVELCELGSTLEPHPSGAGLYANAW